MLSGTPRLFANHPGKAFAQTMNELARHCLCLCRGSRERLQYPGVMPMNAHELLEGLCECSN